MDRVMFRPSLQGRSSRVPNAQKYFVQKLTTADDAELLYSLESVPDVQVWAARTTASSTSSSSSLMLESSAELWLPLFKRLDRVLRNGKAGAKLTALVLRFVISFLQSARQVAATHQQATGVSKHFLPGSSVARVVDYVLGFTSGVGAVTVETAENVEVFEHSVRLLLELLADGNADLANYAVEQKGRMPALLQVFQVWSEGFSFSLDEWATVHLARSEKAAHLAKAAELVDSLGGASHAAGGGCGGPGGGPGGYPAVGASASATSDYDVAGLDDEESVQFRYQLTRHRRMLRKYVLLGHEKIPYLAPAAGGGAGVGAEANGTSPWSPSSSAAEQGGGSLFIPNPGVAPEAGGGSNSKSSINYAAQARKHLERVCCLSVPFYGASAGLTGFVIGSDIFLYFQRAFAAARLACVKCLLLLPATLLSAPQLAKRLPVRVLQELRDQTAWKHFKELHPGFGPDLVSFLQTHAVPPPGAEHLLCAGISMLNFLIDSRSKPTLQQLLGAPMGALFTRAVRRNLAFINARLDGSTAVALGSDEDAARLQGVLPMWVQSLQRAQAKKLVQVSELAASENRGLPLREMLAFVCYAGERVFWQGLCAVLQSVREFANAPSGQQALREHATLGRLTARFTHEVRDLDAVSEENGFFLQDFLFTKQNSFLSGGKLFLDEDDWNDRRKGPGVAPRESRGPGGGKKGGATSGGKNKNSSPAIPNTEVDGDVLMEDAASGGSCLDHSQSGHQPDLQGNVGAKGFVSQSQRHKILQFHSNFVDLLRHYGSKHDVIPTNRVWPFLVDRSEPYFALNELFYKKQALLETILSLLLQYGGGVHAFAQGGATGQGLLQALSEANVWQLDGSVREAGGSGSGSGSAATASGAAPMEIVAGADAGGRDHDPPGGATSTDRAMISSQQQGSWTLRAENQPPGSSSTGGRPEAADSSAPPVEGLPRSFDEIYFPRNVLPEDPTTQEGAARDQQMASSSSSAPNNSHLPVTRKLSNDSILFFPSIRRGSGATGAGEEEKPRTMANALRRVLQSPYYKFACWEPVVQMVTCVIAEDPPSIYDRTSCWSHHTIPTLLPLVSDILASFKEKELAPHSLRVGASFLSMLVLHESGDAELTKQGTLKSLLNLIVDADVYSEIVEEDAAMLREKKRAKEFYKKIEQIVAGGGGAGKPSSPSKSGGVVGAGTSTGETTCALNNPYIAEYDREKAEREERKEREHEARKRRKLDLTRMPEGLSPVSRLLWDEMLFTWSLSADGELADSLVTSFDHLFFPYDARGVDGENDPGDGADGRSMEPEGNALLALHAGGAAPADGSRSQAGAGAGMTGQAQGAGGGSTTTANAPAPDPSLHNSSEEEDSVTMNAGSELLGSGSSGGRGTERTTAEGKWQSMMTSFGQGIEDVVRHKSSQLKTVLSICGDILKQLLAEGQALPDFSVPTPGSNAAGATSATSASLGEPDVAMSGSDVRKHPGVMSYGANPFGDGGAATAGAATTASATSATLPQFQDKTRRFLDRFGNLCAFLESFLNAPAAVEAWFAPGAKYTATLLDIVLLPCFPPQFLSVLKGRHPVCNLFRQLCKVNGVPKDLLERLERILQKHANSVDFLGELVLSNASRLDNFVHLVIPVLAAAVGTGGTFASGPSEKMLKSVVATVELVAPVMRPLLVAYARALALDPFSQPMSAAPSQASSKETGTLLGNGSGDDFFVLSGDYSGGSMMGGISPGKVDAEGNVEMGDAEGNFEVGVPGTNVRGEEVDLNLKQAPATSLLSTASAAARAIPGEIATFRRYQQSQRRRAALYSRKNHRPSKEWRSAFDTVKEYYHYDGATFGPTHRSAEVQVPKLLEVEHLLETLRIFFVLVAKTCNHPYKRQRVQLSAEARANTLYLMKMVRDLFDVELLLEADNLSREDLPSSGPGIMGKIFNAAKQAHAPPKGKETLNSTASARNTTSARGASSASALSADVYYSEATNFLKLLLFEPVDSTAAARAATSKSTLPKLAPGNYHVRALCLDFLWKIKGLPQVAAAMKAYGDKFLADYGYNHDKAGGSAPEATDRWWVLDTPLTTCSSSQQRLRPQERNRAPDEIDEPMNQASVPSSIEAAETARRNRLRSYCILHRFRQKTAVLRGFFDVFEKATNLRRLADSPMSQQYHRWVQSNAPGDTANDPYLLQRHFFVRSGGYDPHNLIASILSLVVPYLHPFLLRLRANGRHVCAVLAVHWKNFQALSDPGPAAGPGVRQLRQSDAGPGDPGRACKSNTSRSSSSSAGRSQALSTQVKGLSLNDVEQSGRTAAAAVNIRTPAAGDRPDAASNGNVNMNDVLAAGPLVQPVRDDHCSAQRLVLDHAKSRERFEEGAVRLLPDYQFYQVLQILQNAFLLNTAPTNDKKTSDWEKDTKDRVGGKLPPRVGNRQVPQHAAPTVSFWPLLTGPCESSDWAQLGTSSGALGGARHQQEARCRRVERQALGYGTPMVAEPMRYDLMLHGVANRNSFVDESNNSSAWYNNGVSGGTSSSSTNTTAWRRDGAVPKSALSATTVPKSGGQPASVDFGTVVAKSGSSAVSGFSAVPGVSGLAWNLQALAQASVSSTTTAGGRNGPPAAPGAASTSSAAAAQVGAAAAEQRPNTAASGEAATAPSSSAIGAAGALAAAADQQQSPWQTAAPDQNPMTQILQALQDSIRPPVVKSAPPGAASSAPAPAVASRTTPLHFTDEQMETFADIGFSESRVRRAIRSMGETQPSWDDVMEYLCQHEEEEEDGFSSDEDDEMGRSGGEGSGQQNLDVAAGSSVAAAVSSGQSAVASGGNDSGSANAGSNAAQGTTSNTGSAAAPGVGAPAGTASGASDASGNAGAGAGSASSTADVDMAAGASVALNTLFDGGERFPVSRHGAFGAGPDGTAPAPGSAESSRAMSSFLQALTGSGFGGATAGSSGFFLGPPADSSSSGPAAVGANSGAAVVGGTAATIAPAATTAETAGLLDLLVGKAASFLGSSSASASADPTGQPAAPQPAVSPFLIPPTAPPHPQPSSLQPQHQHPRPKAPPKTQDTRAILAKNTTCSETNAYGVKVSAQALSVNPPQLDVLERALVNALAEDWLCLTPSLFSPSNSSGEQKVPNSKVETLFQLPQKGLELTGVLRTVTPRQMVKMLSGHLQELAFNSGSILRETFFELLHAPHALDIRDELLRGEGSAWLLSAWVGSIASCNYVELEWKTALKASKAGRKLGILKDADHTGRAPGSGDNVLLELDIVAENRSDRVGREKKSSGGEQQSRVGTEVEKEEDLLMNTITSSVVVGGASASNAAGLASSDGSDGDDRSDNGELLAVVEEAKSAPERTAGLGSTAAADSATSSYLRDAQAKNSVVEEGTGALTGGAPPARPPSGSLSGAAPGTKAPSEETAPPIPSLSEGRHTVVTEEKMGVGSSFFIRLLDGKDDESKEKDRRKKTVAQNGRASILWLCRNLRGHVRELCVSAVPGGELSLRTSASSANDRRIAATLHSLATCLFRDYTAFRTLADLDFQSASLSGLDELAGEAWEETEDAAGLLSESGAAAAAPGAAAARIWKPVEARKVSFYSAPQYLFRLLGILLKKHSEQTYSWATVVGGAGNRPSILPEAVDLAELREKYPFVPFLYANFNEKGEVVKPLEACEQELLRMMSWSAASASAKSGIDNTQQQQDEFKEEDGGDHDLVSRQLAPNDSEPQPPAWLDAALVCLNLILQKADTLADVVGKLAEYDPVLGNIEIFHPKVSPGGLRNLLISKFLKKRNLEALSKVRFHDCAAERHVMDAVQKHVERAVEQTKGLRGAVGKWHDGGEVDAKLDRLLEAIREKVENWQEADPDNEAGGTEESEDGEEWVTKGNRKDASLNVGATLAAGAMEVDAEASGDAKAKDPASEVAQTASAAGKDDVAMSGADDADKDHAGQMPSVQTAPEHTKAEKKEFAFLDEIDVADVAMARTSINLCSSSRTLGKEVPDDKAPGSKEGGDARQVDVALWHKLGKYYYDMLGDDIPVSISARRLTVSTFAKALTSALLAARKADEQLGNDPSVHFLSPTSSTLANAKRNVSVGAPGATTGAGATTTTPGAVAAAPAADAFAKPSVTEASSPNVTTTAASPGAPAQGTASSSSAATASSSGPPPVSTPAGAGTVVASSTVGPAAPTKGPKVALSTPGAGNTATSANPVRSREQDRVDKKIVDYCAVMRQSVKAEWQRIARDRTASKNKSAPSTSSTATEMSAVRNALRALLMLEHADVQKLAEEQAKLNAWLSAAALDRRIAFSGAEEEVFIGSGAGAGRTKVDPKLLYTVSNLPGGAPPATSSAGEERNLQKPSAGKDVEMPDRAAETGTLLTAEELPKRKTGAANEPADGAVPLEREDEEARTESVRARPSAHYCKQLVDVQNACLDVVARFPGLYSRTACVLVQLLHTLTRRDHVCAADLIESVRAYTTNTTASATGTTSVKMTGVSVLLCRLTRTSSKFPGFLRLVSEILCHVLDDKASLREKMEHAIVQLFREKAHKKAHRAANEYEISMNLEEIVSQCHDLAHREWDTFEEAVAGLCYRVRSSQEKSIATGAGVLTRKDLALAKVKKFELKLHKPGDLVSKPGDQSAKQSGGGPLATSSAANAPLSSAGVASPTSPAENPGNTSSHQTDVVMADATAASAGAANASSAAPVGGASAAPPKRSNVAGDHQPVDRGASAMGTKLLCQLFQHVYLTHDLYEQLGVYTEALQQQQEVESLPPKEAKKRRRHENRRYPLLFGMDHLLYCIATLVSAHPALLQTFAMRQSAVSRHAPATGLLAAVCTQIATRCSGATDGAMQGEQLLCASGSTASLVSAAQPSPADPKEGTFLTFLLRGILPYCTVSEVALELKALEPFGSPRGQGDDPAPGQQLHGGAWACLCLGESTRILRWIVSALNHSGLDFRKRMLHEILAVLKHCDPSLLRGRATQPRHGGRTPSDGNSSNSPPSKIRKLDPLLSSCESGAEVCGVTGAVVTRSPGARSGDVFVPPLELDSGLGTGGATTAAPSGNAVLSGVSGSSSSKPASAAAKMSAGAGAGIGASAPGSGSCDKKELPKLSERETLRTVLCCAVLITKTTSLNSLSYRKDLTALQRRAAARRDKEQQQEAKDAAAASSSAATKEESKSASPAGGLLAAAATMSASSASDAAGGDAKEANRPAASSSAGTAPPAGKETVGTVASQNKASAQERQSQELYQQISQLQQQYAVFMPGYAHLRTFLSKVLEELQTHDAGSGATGITHLGIVLSALENLTKPEFCYLLRTSAAAPPSATNSRASAIAGAKKSSSAAAAGASGANPLVGGTRSGSGSAQLGSGTSASATILDAAAVAAGSNVISSMLHDGSAPASGLSDLLPSDGPGSHPRLGRATTDGSYDELVPMGDSIVDAGYDHYDEDDAQHHDEHGEVDENGDPIDHADDHGHYDEDEDMDEDEEDMEEEEDDDEEDEYYEDENGEYDYEAEEYVDEQGAPLIDLRGEDEGIQLLDHDAGGGILAEEGDGGFSEGGFFDDEGRFHDGGADFMGGLLGAGGISLGGGGADGVPANVWMPAEVHNTGAVPPEWGANAVGGRHIIIASGGGAGGGGGYFPAGPSAGQPRYSHLYDHYMTMTGAGGGSGAGWHSREGRWQDDGDPAGDVTSRQLIAGALAFILTGQNWVTEMDVASLHPYFGVHFEQRGILPEFLRGRRRLLRFLELNNSSSEIGFLSREQRLVPCSTGSATVVASSTGGPLPFSEQVTELLTDGEDRFYQVHDGMPPAQQQPPTASYGQFATVLLPPDEVGAATLASSVHPPTVPSRSASGASAQTAVATTWEPRVVTRQMETASRVARLGGQAVYNLYDDLRTDAPPAEAAPRAPAAGPASASPSDRDTLGGTTATAIPAGDATTGEAAAGGATASGVNPAATATAPAANDAGSAAAGAGAGQSDAVAPNSREDGTAGTPAGTAGEQAGTRAEPGDAVMEDVSATAADSGPPAPGAATAAADAVVLPAAAAVVPPPGTSTAGGSAAGAQQASTAEVAPAAGGGDAEMADAAEEVGDAPAAEASSAAPDAEMADANQPAVAAGTEASSAAEADVGNAAAAPTTDAAPVPAANADAAPAAGAETAPAAAEQPAEPEEPDLDYALPALRALVTCLSMRQREILTTTGIDADFLMALPEDMQSEQIAGAIQGMGGCSSLRAGITRALPLPTDEAVVAATRNLPAELRRDVTRLLERAAQPAANNGGASGGAGGGQGADSNEMDNATFFATLDPETRQGILAEADDAVLATLPADLRAEAYIIRERRAVQIANDRARRERAEAERQAARQAQQSSQQSRQIIVPRDGPMDIETILRAIDAETREIEAAISGGGSFENLRTRLSSLRTRITGLAVAQSNAISGLPFENGQVPRQFRVEVAAGTDPSDLLFGGVNLPSLFAQSGGRQVQVHYPERGATVPTTSSERALIFTPTNPEQLEPDVLRTVLKRFSEAEKSALVAGGVLVGQSGSSSSSSANAFENSSLGQHLLAANNNKAASSSSSGGQGLATAGSSSSSSSQALAALDVFDSRETLTLCKLIFTQRYTRVRLLLRQILYHVALHPTARARVLGFFLQLLAHDLVRVAPPSVEEESWAQQWTPRGGEVEGGPHFAIGAELLQPGGDSPAATGQPVRQRIWDPTARVPGAAAALPNATNMGAVSSSSSSFFAPKAFHPPPRVLPAVPTDASMLTSAASSSEFNAQSVSARNEEVAQLSTGTTSGPRLAACGACGSSVLLTSARAADMVQRYGAISPTGPIPLSSTVALDITAGLAQLNLPSAQAALVFRQRALEGLRDVVMKVPTALDFFLQGENLSRLVLMTDVMGYGSASHVSYITETVECLLLGGAAVSFAAADYNQERKALRKSLCPDALRSLVQYLCLAPPAEHETSLLRVKSVLVSLIRDEVEEACAGVTVPEELMPPALPTEGEGTGGGDVEMAPADGGSGTTVTASATASVSAPAAGAVAAAGSSASSSTAAAPAPAAAAATSSSKGSTKEKKKKKTSSSAPPQTLTAEQKAKRDGMVEHILTVPSAKRQAMYQVLLANAGRIIHRVSRTDITADSGAEAIFLRLLKILQDLFTAERREAEKAVAAAVVERQREVLEKRSKETTASSATTAEGGASSSSTAGSSCAMTEVDRSDRKGGEREEKDGPSGEKKSSASGGEKQELPFGKDLGFTAEEAAAGGMAKLQSFLDSAGVDALWNFLDRTLTKATTAAEADAAQSPRAAAAGSVAAPEASSASSSAGPTAASGQTGADPGATARSSTPLTTAAKAIDLDISKQMPLIEALFLFHCGEDHTKREKESEKDAKKEWMKVVAKKEGEEEEENPRIAKLKLFSERHSKAINHSVKQSPSLLQKSLAPIVRYCPYVLDFNNKRQFFRQRIKSGRDSYRYSTLRLNVRRSQVFMDSFHQLRMRTAEEMKGKVSIQFTGEEGMDAGGLTREWYNILAQDMFNAGYALFEPAGGKPSTFHPNPMSGVNADHLHFFKFAGRILGKAIFDNHNIPTYFTRSLYKQMLKKCISPQDMEALDPEYYKQVQMMQQMDDVSCLELNMTAERQEFGELKIFDLVENGSKVAVTDENKEEYIQKMCEFKLFGSVKEQIAAFLAGFHELLPAEIAIFDDKELELLIAGLPKIDLRDLRANTEYQNYSESSQQIKWFWEILEEFTEEQRAWFLQFVTGTSQVPLEGFKALVGMRGPQKFSIHRAHSTERLPTAHTCFNQLDLPEYPSAAVLKTKLLQAVEMAHEGFGFI